MVGSEISSLQDKQNVTMAVRESDSENLSCPWIPFRTCIFSPSGSVGFSRVGMRAVGVRGGD